MKRALPIQPPRLRLSLAPLGLATSLLLAPTAFALTPDNPYSAISSRNAFALKPPVVVTNTPPPPVVAPAGIDLQGIHTILGKPQVFLKIKLPPRPPKPAEDQSIVLEPGQREGDVEVISIDVAAGAVRLRNRGEELALNLKDHAATPTASPIAAPAVPGLTLPRPAGLPAPAGVIPRPNPTAPAPGGVSATTIGGNRGSTAAAAANNLPARNIRSGLTPGGPAQTAQPVRELTAEEGAALLEINRKANEGRGLPFPPPRVNLNQ